jgi:hypothetical protein
LTLGLRELTGLAKATGGTASLLSDAKGVDVALGQLLLVES